MATSVTDLVRHSNDSYMKFIDYQSTYRDDNKEFLRGDMWEFSFLTHPRIVYYPGDHIVKARLNNVSTSIFISTTKHLFFIYYNIIKSKSKYYFK